MTQQKNTVPPTMSRSGAVVLTILVFMGLLFAGFALYVATSGLFARIMGSISAEELARLSRYTWSSIAGVFLLGIGTFLPLARALYALLVYLFKRRFVPVVTLGSILPASIILGVLGPVFVVAAVTGAIRVESSPATVAFAAFGWLLIVVVAPWAVWKHRQQAKP